MHVEEGIAEISSLRASVMRLSVMRINVSINDQVPSPLGTTISECLIPPFESLEFQLQPVHTIKTHNSKVFGNANWRRHVPTEKVLVQKPAHSWDFFQHRRQPNMHRGTLSP